ncbi:hypothetical protein [Massilia sp. S19_KUP03_FR1]|uniref:hypothetical protein n=1 Tax=Massilia sp. S19_KUP03_FR1 TaxID=3025503 RepID=UPI002FCD6D24
MAELIGNQKAFRSINNYLLLLFLGWHLPGIANEPGRLLAPLLGLPDTSISAMASSARQLPDTPGNAYFEQIRNEARALLDAGASDRNDVLIRECRAAIAASYLTSAAALDISRANDVKDRDQFFSRLNSGIAHALNANPRIEFVRNARHLNLPEAIAGPAPPPESPVTFYPWFDTSVNFLMVSAGSALARRDASNLDNIPLDVLIDKQDSNEKFSAWSSRVCRRFMFIDGEYVDYIRVKTDIHEGGAGVNKVAEIKFHISNTANRHLKGSLLMAVLGLDNTVDKSSYDVQFARIIPFDLKPGEKVPLAEKFPYSVPQGHGIQLMLGTDIGEGPIEVGASGPEQPTESCAEKILKNSPEDVFGTSLAAYAMDSVNDYINSVSETVGDAMFPVNEGKHPIPGSSRVVIFRGGPAAMVNIAVGGPTTLANASAQFDRTVAAVRKRCGRNQGQVTETQPKGSFVRDFDYKMFSPRAGLRVSVSLVEGKQNEKKSTKKYSTSIVIDRHIRLFP